jgi:hypothetical protein
MQSLKWVLDAWFFCKYPRHNSAEWYMKKMKVSKITIVIPSSMENTLDHSVNFSHVVTFFYRVPTVQHLNVLNRAF